MLNELPKRYKFVRCSHIPATECNGANFRSNLLSLLYCEPMESSYNIALYQLSAHFNGDISKHDEWVHYCQGPDCCRNLQHSLNKAGLLQGGIEAGQTFPWYIARWYVTHSIWGWQIGFHCWVKQRSIPWLRRKRLTDFRFQIQSVGLELSSTGFIYFEYII